MDRPEITEAELNQLEEIILAKVQQRTPPRMNEDTFIAKAFRHHDIGSKGWCDFDTFKKALIPFTSGIQEQDLHAIFLRYAPEGSMHYKSFAMDFVAGARRIPGLAPDAGGEAWESIEDILMRIKVYLYSQGPHGIIDLATAFRDADDPNSRAMSFETFCAIMTKHFEGTDCPLQDDHIEQIFTVFQQPYAPSQIAYDELFLALKEEPSQERRGAIRAAFRRLDQHSESLVEMDHMIKMFNAVRHPQVADGTKQPDEVLNEFAETMKDLVAFRRGQRSYPTNLVAWEEFEDYYKFISGCYETDAAFVAILTRVWDLDKKPDMAIEARASQAGRAAGLPPRSRAGLHHWQENTLPTHHHHSADHAVNLDAVLQRAREQIANQGLRGAIDVVKAFYAADDDIDDALDTYEFRRACQQSKLSFKAGEEKRIFEACGCAVDPGSKGAKLQVPTFLTLLHGELTPARMAVVQQAFRALGGDPDDEASALSPAVLKDSFACEAHPLVQKGERDPASVLSEFLDTFSLLAHVRGGCQNGMVAFSDFVAYYQVVSSMTSNDAYFCMLLRRLWSIDGGVDVTNGRSGSPGASTKRTTPATYEELQSPRRESPMAGRRPPLHSGPSAYSTAPQPVDQQHRRFLRKELAGGYPDSGSVVPGAGGAFPPVAPASSATVGVSPITKSSIIFDERDQSELGTVISRLRESIGRRQFKGWLSMAEKFALYDHRKNGGIMRLDFERLHKTLGLGLSPEERESLFKGLAAGRKDGAMDYRMCLSKLKVPLSGQRQAAVDDLFQAFRQDSDAVDSQDFKASFQAASSPACLLMNKDPRQVGQEFCAAVDFFEGASMTPEAFNDFFSIVAAIYPSDDEFHLMTTAAFGLPH